MAATAHTLRNRRRRGMTLAVLALVVVFLLLFDWNCFKPLVERRVSAATEREFHIEGDLGVRLAWPPRIRMDRLRLANPAWAREPQLVSAERAEFTVDLWRLLHGDIVLPEVRLQQPVVALEKNRSGTASWVIGAQDEKPPAEQEPKSALPEIGLLQIDRGSLVYFDPVQGSDILLKLSTTGEGAQQGIRFDIGGVMQQLRLQAQGSGGGLLSLEDADSAYPLQGDFKVGRTEGSIKGTITGLVALSAADLQLKLKGDDLSELLPLISLHMPQTPPYEIGGRLLRVGELWQFHQFTGRLGDSDLSGDIDVSYSGRPRIQAKLTSRQLDLDDLAGFIGGTPGTGAGETASAQQQRQAGKDEANPRLLPDRPINLSALRAMDADVTYSAKSIRNPKTPIEDLDVHLLLADGLLRTEPLNFGVAGGDVRSVIKLDARRQALQVEADVQFRKLQLARLFPQSELMKQNSAGLIGGRAALKGQGESLSGLMATADGELGLAMSSGYISNLVLEAIGLDGAEALRFLFGGDRPVRLRCAVADVGVEQGVLRSRAIVFDTTDTKISVDGQVDLRDESLDLKLRPEPKDYSPLSLRSPLHVHGTLKDPRITPDKRLYLKGGLAVLLGTLVNPLLALIPLIETGQGKNADCEQLMAAAQAAQAPAAAAP